MNEEVQKLVLERLASFEKRDAQRLAAICATQHVLSVHIAKQSGRSEEEVMMEIRGFEEAFEHHLLSGLQDKNPKIAAWLNRPSGPKKDGDPPAKL